VAVVLVQAADAHFEVFVELLAIVSLRENRDIPEVQRNSVRPVVAHGAQELAVAESMIASELDLADLDLGTLHNLENENDRVTRGDALILRRDFGELAPVLAEQILKNHFRFLDLRGIERTFHGEADFAFLEAIKNVGLRN